MSKGKTEPNNIISRAITFVREAWDELKKVHAPSREETIRVTMLVMAMVFIFAFFLGITDLIVGEVMRGILT